MDIAEEYVGPNIALFASHYISKPPEDGQSVLWHQDGSYWPLEPMEVVTLWLAVDDATPENGCLRVIPGTQAMQLHEMERRVDVPNVLNSQIAPELVEADRAVDLVLSAGDVSVHHPNIIHGSNANTSSRTRTGLTIRYIPTTTRIVSDEQWPSAFLLRGEAVANVNELPATTPLSCRGAHGVRGLRAVGLDLTPPSFRPLPCQGRGVMAVLARHRAAPPAELSFRGGEAHRHLIHKKTYPCEEEHRWS